MDAQTSCVSTADVQPGTATYNPASATYEYSTAVVTGDLSQCLDGAASVSVIYNDTEIASSAAAHTITAAEVSAGEFSTTLNVGVAAGLDSANTKWGLIIRSQAATEAVTNIVGVEANNTVALEWDQPA